MSYWVIGDGDTVLGYRFAGVHGDAVSTATEAREAFRRALGDEGITVLMLTEAVEEMLSDEVTAHRLEAVRPYVTVIEDVWGSRGGRRSLQELINEAVGVKLSSEDEEQK